jgi:hypothetical protein
MKIITSLTIVLLLAFSCKSTSKPMNSDNPIPPSNVKTYSKGEGNQEKIVFDMIISFISKGEGLDYKLVEKIDATINDFNKKNKTKITPEIVSWGREGEKDYNFILKNLSTPLQKEFINSIEGAIGKTDMAHITFNHESVHKR